MKKFVSQKIKSKRNVVLLLGSLGIVLLIGVAFFREPWVLKVNDQAITEEEYAFYQKINPRLNEHELQKQIVEDKVQLQQAEKLGIKGAATYKQLTQELKKVNKENEKKLQKGQVVYGLKKYDLESFYPYSLSNTINKLKEKMRKDISDQAVKKYYQAHSEQFRTIDTKKLYRIRGPKQTLQALTAKEFSMDEIGSAKDVMVEETTLNEQSLRDWIKYREDELSDVVTLKAKTWSELFGTEAEAWGYYCMDSQGGTIQPLASVEESIRIQLEKENYQKQVKKWVEAARVERK